MENEAGYARVVATRSGNNGGNKIKLRTGIGKNRARERTSQDQTTFIPDEARKRRRVMREGMVREEEGKTIYPATFFSLLFLVTSELYNIYVNRGNV